MSISILTVCVANICRSPMAEGLLHLQLPALEITSAGLDAAIGCGADPYVLDLMRSRGIDLAMHRARQLLSLHCRQADLILVMEEVHRHAIERCYPFARGRVFRIGQFGSFDVPDPSGGEPRQFDGCLDLIEQGVEDWVARIHTLFAPS
ncbi:MULTISPECIES: low molecular weight protein-tyrosine-phosphatase [Burkholderia]|nr:MULTISPECIES: low molecular weight protein-tyrosine-phosphatase [Burkholderia]